MKSCLFLISTLIPLSLAAALLPRDDFSEYQDTPQDANDTLATADEFIQNGCKEVLFFFARGSMAPGNMGPPESVGPQTANGLKLAFGNDSVGVQGVPYDAWILSNLWIGGASYSGRKNMKKLIENAVRECPKSIIVAGGYSQGAAVTHHAIENLSKEAKHKVAGVVTYGDTRRDDDNGRIPGFPSKKLLILCNKGDWVCEGWILGVRKAHYEYGKRVPEAVAFLTEKIKAVQAARG
ncbi:hypothetical protein HYALB_00008226 [Hymenoscyphus albidus]|uniref:Cutinase n=1 Tax=Hymenoscyphus albidus TaxID=595503 RepID=A0A9N9LHX3_9HELO|nr:hypothetical protein HYALB_00008226 [Hymenoscyphus albidus]